MNLNDSLGKIKANEKCHFGVFLIILTLLTGFMMISYHPLGIGHDTVFHFRRFKVLIENLYNPYLVYIDWSSLDGYGYFQKAIYSDFILIPFAFIARLTNIEFGYQSMIFVMTLLCGAFTYKMVHRIYRDSSAAFIGAILFTFCSYRLLDVYHRAALGEVFSFTFLPLAIWGLYEIIKGDYRRKWYIFTIGCSLQVLSHILSTVLLAITILIFLIIYYKEFKKDVKRLYYLLFSSLVAIAVCSYYLFPMLEQIFSIDFYFKHKQMVAVGDKTALDLNWILWGMFGGGVQPRQIFIPGVGILLTVAVCCRLFVKEKSTKIRSLDVSVLIALVYIFASSSLFPWEYYPFNKLGFMLQFPWRLLEFSSFFFAIAGGYYLSRSLDSNVRIFVANILIIFFSMFMIMSDSKLYKEIRSQKLDIYTYGNTFEIGGQELVPYKTPSLEYIIERKSVIKHKSTDTRISNYERDNNGARFNVDVLGKDKLELPMLYYKGYVAKLNGDVIPLRESNNGFIEVDVMAQGRVEVYYEVTTMQKVGFAITVLTLVSLFVYALRSRKNTSSGLDKCVDSV